MAQLKKIKRVSFVLVLALILTTGLSFAWNAVWNGTDWIQSGAMIESKKIAENFEYLKRKSDDLESIINNYHDSGSGTFSDCTASTFKEAGAEHFYPQNPRNGTVMNVNPNIICPDALNKEVVSCKVDVSAYRSAGTAVIYRLTQYKRYLNQRDQDTGTLECKVKTNNFINRINYQCINGSFKYIGAEHPLCRAYVNQRASGGGIIPNGDCGGGGC